MVCVGFGMFLTGQAAAVCTEWLEIIFVSEMNTRKLFLIQLNREKKIISTHLSSVRSIVNSLVVSVLFASTSQRNTNALLLCVAMYTYEVSNTSMPSWTSSTVNSGVYAPRMHRNLSSFSSAVHLATISFTFLLLTSVADSAPLWKPSRK